MEKTVNNAVRIETTAVKAACIDGVQVAVLAFLSTSRAGVLRSPAHLVASLWFCLASMLAGGAWLVFRHERHLRGLQAT